MCLATLLGAGLPLERALIAVARSSAKGKLRGAFETLREQVRSGARLADAMKRQRPMFPEFVIAVVEAGERSGDLAGALGRLAKQLAWMKASRDALVSSLLYPAAIVASLIAALVFLVFFVLPELGAMFESARVELPPQTKILLLVGNVLRASWIGVVLIGFVLTAGFVWKSRTRSPQHQASRWFRQTPLARLMRDVGANRTAGMLALLIEGGMSPAAALRLSAESPGGTDTRDHLKRAAESVSAGASFSKALRSHTHMPEVVFELVAIGEASGRLGASLRQAAEILESETKLSIERLTALIVPILTVALGVIVAFVMYAVVSGIVAVNGAVM